MTTETLQENNEKLAGNDVKPPEQTENSVNGLELINGFNEILGAHIERLLDTRFGIEELELNIFSISCIVILATRETEIETFPARPPSRYTESGLIEELAEMSIESDIEINKVIRDMISKDYLKITDARIFCNKPMSSMAQLFDRIFPKMPGLNLVAYLGQMIDEVTAGRKPQTEASNQFNEMLEIQGVPINGQATPKSPKTRFSHLRVGNSPSERKKRLKLIPGKPANIFSQLKKGTVLKTPITVKENITSPVEEEIKDNSDLLQARELSASINPDTVSDDQKIEDIAAGAEVKEEVHDTEIDLETEEPQGKISDSFEPANDREIEDRILEFEKQLGLKCPLCRTGGIKTSETAKGKTYYHCSESDCTFISWGKPYYFECPKCESNFLIEATDSNGRNFLKCPKATCTHWQKFPWDESDKSPEYSSDDTDSGTATKKPKRKVRRKRRVVRRKKSA